MIRTYTLGKLTDGRSVTGYEMQNTAGMRVLIADFGGAIWQLYAPDRQGRLSDVVLGYDCAADYEKSDGYIGALIGRWGNRIGNARFALNGKTYTLYANDHKNHLHGGKIGFDRRFWQVTPCGTEEEPALLLHLDSPDGEEGYPGNLAVDVIYTLRPDNALSIRYVATTDKDTVLNLTNHTYFNLGGYASGSVLNHVLCLKVTDYLETDEELIPTGRRVPVAGTPFDFNAPKTVEKDLKMDGSCPALTIAGGYDHSLTFAPADVKPGEVPCVGYLEDPASGRRMYIDTNQPCVQLYTGNFLADDGVRLKNGCRKEKRQALCLETQRMPDSMNHEGFTPCVLHPGETYDYTTVYRFATV